MVLVIPRHCFLGLDIEALYGTGIFHELSTNATFKEVSLDNSKNLT